jgi:predicted naringenin-chalcone synthase
MKGTVPMPAITAPEQLATQEEIIQQLMQEVPESTQEEIAELLTAAAAIESVSAVSPDTIQMANKVYQDVVNDERQAQRRRLKLATLLAARRSKQLILTLGG